MSPCSIAVSGLTVRMPSHQVTPLVRQRGQPI
jgi:hypothetical protein